MGVSKRNSKCIENFVSTPLAEIKKEACVRPPFWN